MNRGVHRVRRTQRHTARSTALLILGLSAEAAAFEPPKFVPDPSFIDTRQMQRHAGLDLPPLMLLGELATAEPMMSSRTPMPPEAAAWRREVADAAEVAFGGGYQGNGSIAVQSGIAHMGDAEAGMWAGLRHDHAKPYEDGGGARVNYGYDRVNAQMTGEVRPNARSRAAGFVMRDSFTDYRLPGYGIDATDYDRYIASAMVEHAPENSAFRRVQAGLTFDGVTYDADNFSLRNRGSQGLAYKGLLTTTRGLVRGEFETGRFRNALTADLSVLHHQIDIAARSPALGTASYRMPDVETVVGGLSLSSSTALSPQDTLTGGIRVDLSHADANKRSMVPPVTGTGASSYQYSPQQLWDRYYGPTESDPLTVGLSARLQALHDLEDKSGRLHVDIRRAVRNPDAGERFYAGTGPAAITQVGNPDLRPEAHHRLELGGRKDFAGFRAPFAPGNPTGSWRLSASVYGDRVVDFITADRARGQAGILRSDGAVIYRNVEAYLAGAVAEAWWQPLASWGARAKLAWMRGENMSDGIPLYQIAPLEGEVVIEHRRELAPDAMGSAGLRLSFAGSQNRIDSYSATGSAQDTAGATSGWAILDLFFGAKLGERAALTTGLANLLDKQYHLHVNPLPQSPTTRMQRAPGRGAFVQATIGF